MPSPSAVRTGMNAELIADCETLWRIAERLQRAGLIVDPQVFSRSQRRAYFALQCQLAEEPEPITPQQSLIGFTYPNAR
jgi:hypothetical protein